MTGCQLISKIMRSAIACSCPPAWVRISRDDFYELIDADDIPDYVVADLSGDEKTFMDIPLEVYDLKREGHDYDIT